MNLKDRYRNHQEIAAQGQSEASCLSSMTALSLETVSTSQIATKIVVLPPDFAAYAISAGCDTDLNDKNSFNNRYFDSAVFPQERNFRRQHNNRIH